MLNITLCQKTTNRLLLYCVRDCLVANNGILNICSLSSTKLVATFKIGTHDGLCWALKALFRNGLVGHLDFIQKTALLLLIIDVQAKNRFK